MVILDYNATDRSYLVVTSVGPQELIFFQEGFYRLELCFQSLDDAVRRCRRDLDYRGVFSIVVKRAEQGEVWVRLTDETDDGLNIVPSTHPSDLAPESGLLKLAS